jgi:hypothetical protein
MVRGEMLARMSSSELSGWRAFYQAEPFGEQRADVRAALVCKVLADIARAFAKGKGPEPRIEDFMPFQQEEEHDPAAVAEQVRALFRSLPGRKPAG